MNCPYCGAPLPNTAKFCTNCGAQLQTQAPAPTEPQVPGQTPTPTTPHVPGQTPPDPTQPTAGAPNKKNKHVAIVAAVAAALTLLIIAAISVTTCAYMGSAASKANRQTHPVTFVVSIDGYDTGSSRIPVHITGTDVDGNDVDKTIFMAFSGADTELVEGTYHAEVVGSPITPEGVIFSIPTTTLDFTLGSDLEPGETFVFPNNSVFVFEPLAPEQMTDEAMQNALDWARKDEQSGVDVDKLEKAMKAYRTTGLNAKAA